MPRKGQIVPTRPNSRQRDIVYIQMLSPGIWWNRETSRARHRHGFGKRMTIQGITSDMRQQLTADAERLRGVGLTALIDYYAAADDVTREAADATLREAYNEAVKAQRRQDALEELQAEHLAKSADIAQWLRTLTAANT